MSRIFWDTMLLIYLLEGNPVYRNRINETLLRSRKRRDKLFTSYLSLGEVIAGVDESVRPWRSRVIRETLEELGFTFLPFDSGAVAPFSKLRAEERLKAPDAIQLACASSAGIDLFLTGDKQLMKLNVPGIQFIADFNTPIL